MELRQLKYFVTLAEHLHFSHAAALLELAPSALTMQLQRLELELGTRLVERTKRCVSLTSAGQLFLVEARATLYQAEQAKTVARRAGRGEAGEIRIGDVISAACSGVVQNLRSRFRSAAPSVSVNLQELESPLQVQLLEEGSLDACIVRTVAGDYDKVQRISLGSELTVIAVPAGHALLDHPGITLKDLAHERFIVPQFTGEPGFSRHLARIGEQAGFTPQIGHQTRDFITALTLVGAGYGIAAVPASVSALSMPGISYLPVCEILERSELFILFRRHERSPVVNRLRDLTKSGCGTAVHLN